jgi:hypothetical protein
MRITPAGNVGIGTTAPVEKLHVSGTFTQLRLEDTDDGSVVYLSAPGFGYTGGVGTVSAHDFPIFTSGLDRVTVTAAGSVGIGTSSPATNLDLTSPGGIVYQTYHTAGSGAGFGNGLLVGIEDFSPAAWFYNYESSPIYMATGAALVTLAPAGNVGLNTSTPSATLDVLGTMQYDHPSAAVGHVLSSTTVDGDAVWSDPNLLVTDHNTLDEAYDEGGAGAGRVIVADAGAVHVQGGGGLHVDGNLGVGTTAPTDDIVISKTVATLRITDSDDNAHIYLAAPGAGYTGGVGTTSNHDLALFTNNLDRMTIQASTGNVGVGNLAPAYKLQVEGRVYSGHNNIDGNSYTDASFIANSVAGNDWPWIAMVENGNDAEGAAIFGIPAPGGGIQVGIANTTAFAPVQASAFVVSSDIRMKHDVDEITTDEFGTYMSQIRNIQSARYKYNWESSGQNSHIGVIAQTLPAEVQARISSAPGVDGEERIGLSLSDLTGLTLVGVKAIDHKQSEMEKVIADQQLTISQQQQAIAELQRQVELLKTLMKD